MAKLKSLEELAKLREDMRTRTEMRVTGTNPDRIVLSVGMATCGIAAGARDTLKALTEELAAHGIENVSVVATGCLGYCYAEPVVEVRFPDKGPILYGDVDAKRAKEIVDQHLVKGILLDHAIIGKGAGRR
jgi:NADP-reducing hydrogenase subunit HndB